MNTPPTFHLRLFGTPSIEVDGGPRLTGRVSQRHRLALLAYLALAPGGRASRDKVVALLWPESDQEKGRNLLSVAMYVIRTTLGDAALAGTGDELQLDSTLVRSDVSEFEGALARGDSTAATSLYGGPFLDGFFLSDAPEFEQWVSRERERLAGGYHKALETLAEQSEAAGDFPGAADRWKERATQSPYDSRIALRLMQALDSAGNRAGALSHASVHERMLKEEFGIALPADLQAQVENLRASKATALPRTELKTELKTEPRTEPTAEPTARPTAGRPAEQAPEAVPDAPATSRSALPPLRPASPRRWTRAALIAALAIGVVGFASWYRNRGDEKSSFAPRERSIAVLPFADLSPARDNEYFSDGLTEEIITGLSGVPELKVISRTSAMHYKGASKPLRQIADDLGVAHILEGSVRRDSTRVRITAQLIDARTDEHLWAQSYDAERRDVLGVQEQIARQVVQALQLELGERGQSALVRERTKDAEAMRLYRHARFLWSNRTREGHVRAAEYYRQAIARDSGFADAFAGLADTYLTAYQLNVSPFPEAEGYSRAKWAVERALALDANSADAHATYGIFLHWQRNWPASERALRRALQLNPNHASAHSWYGLVLSGLGRAKEALDHSRRAYELDPFSVAIVSNYGWQCQLSGDPACAVEQFQRTIDIRPTYGRAHERLAIVLAQQGKLDDALRAIQTAVELSPERPDFVADMAYVQALRGDRAAALVSLERAKRDPFEPASIGRAYVALRMLDSAFAWLDRGNWQWTHRTDRRDPAFNPIRRDPRFIALSARIDRDLGVR